MRQDEEAICKRAKRELRQYSAICKRIGELRRRKADLMEQATRATSSLSATNSSGTSSRSKVEGAVVSIVDLETQLDDMMAEMAHRRYIIQASIASLDDVQHQRILEQRYIDRRSWVAINADMHISSSESFRIHTAALAAFWSEYKKRAKE